MGKNNFEQTDSFHDEDGFNSEGINNRVRKITIKHYEGFEEIYKKMQEQNSGNNPNENKSNNDNANSNINNTVDNNDDEEQENGKKKKNGKTCDKKKDKRDKKDKKKDKEKDKKKDKNKNEKVDDESSNDSGDEGENNSSNDDNDNSNKKVSKKFEYNFYKELCIKYHFKCLNEKVYVYQKKEGRYILKNDNELKILIRKGWKDDIQEKLNKNNMAEILERLKTKPRFQVDEDYFNSKPYLMNFLNGVLNLKTGQFEKHSRKYKFTHCIQANYIEDPEPSYKFQEFIETCTEGNREKEKHLQEVVGYMLSELYTAKKVPMLIGKPHSGKSTLNRIISTLIGKEDVANVPLHRLHERFVLAHLSTKKVNICSEINDEALSNIEVFKNITGNDEIVAEYKGKDHFTYSSKIKLLFSGNTMPVLKNRDVTSAFFDRLTFIIFNYTVPEEERDYELEQDILKYDRSYIVYWAVEGLKRLMNNKFIFSECKESIVFKQKYIKEQNNTVDFVKHKCIFGKGFKIHKRVLYNEYLKYCYENCFTPLDKDDFFTEIEKNNVKKARFRIDGSNLWGYKGVGIKKEDT